MDSGSVFLWPTHKDVHSQKVSSRNYFDAFFFEITINSIGNIIIGNMYSRLLKVVFLLSLHCSGIQSLDQNYYYNWPYGQTYSSNNNFQNTLVQPIQQSLETSPLQGQQAQNPLQKVAVATILPKQEEGHGETMAAGHGEESAQEHGGYGGGYGQGWQPPPSHEEHPMIEAVNKLGKDGVIKILLAVLPFAVCLIFVPSLMVVIGLLLIPVVRWEAYKNEEVRSLQSLDHILQSISNAFQ